MNKIHHASLWPKVILGISIPVLTFILYRRYRQQVILKQTKLKGPGSIDRFIDFPVDTDVILKGLIRGTSLNNPILLCVHGGPGVPDMLVARKYDELLVKEFTVIRFDQRGSGKSKAKNLLIRRLSVSTYVNDIIKVAEQVKRRFPDNDIYLHGRSWGSLISILAIKKAPRLFKAYIGVGQIVNLNESEHLSYDYVAVQAIRKNKRFLLNLFRSIDRNNFFYKISQLTMQRWILNKFGGIFYNSKTKRKIAAAALFSPDYSLLELAKIIIMSQLLVKQLFPKLAVYNLFKEAESLSVPCFFIEGKYDYLTPYIVTEKYFQILNAPLKQFYLFEKSGHVPIFEEPERFFRIMDQIKSILLISKSEMNEMTSK